jgi:hypothetical protein
MSQRKSNKRDRGRSAARTTTSSRSTPARAEAAPQGGGLFGRLLGPPIPPSMSLMPTYRVSLGQGFLLVASNPVLLFGPMLVVFLTWLLLIAAGFVGTGIALSQMWAMPPLSTAFDTQNAISIAGQQSGLVLALPLLLVRAVLVGVLAGLIVEGFERHGTVTAGGAIRGLVAFPLVLAYLILSFVGLFLAQFGSALGPGLGTLVQVVLPALILFALGFVPFAAVRERRPLAETLRRAYAGARTPGGRQLAFCVLYVLLAFVLPLFIPSRTTITANLDPWTWVGLFLLTYVHVSFTAAMAYRWLAVESSIDPAPRR